jgi:hypothetical protein
MHKRKFNWVTNEKGQHVDASGVPIVDERVLRHKESIKMALLSIFPRGYCQNSGDEFEDLLQYGYIEVKRSLTLFDGHKCLTIVNSKAKHKRMSDEDRLQWKQDFQLEALLKGEKEWVMNALKRFFWRIRYDNSEKEKGGLSVSVDFNEIVADISLHEDTNAGTAFEGCSFAPDLISDVSSVEDIGFSKESNNVFNQALIDYDMMLDLAKKGEEAASLYYNELSKERQEAAVSIFRRKNDSKQSDQARKEKMGEIYSLKSSLELEAYEAVTKKKSKTK